MKQIEIVKGEIFDLIIELVVFLISFNDITQNAVTWVTSLWDRKQ